MLFNDKKILEIDFKTIKRKLKESGIISLNGNMR